MARKPKTMQPVKQNLTYEKQYRRLLRSYVKKVDLIITRRLFDLLDKLTSKYTTNDDDVISAFSGVNQELDKLFIEFAPLVVQMLTRMKKADQKKFYRHFHKYLKSQGKDNLIGSPGSSSVGESGLLDAPPLRVESQKSKTRLIPSPPYAGDSGVKTLSVEYYDKIMGISLENILERDNIRDSFSLAIEQNLDLIKSLTQKQLSRIKNVVLSDLRAGNYSPKTIRDTIEHDFGISSRHADFIARDQSHKMTSTLNQLRYQNLGITRYIWRTARDRRVRGTPRSKDGKYPNARPSHYARENKVFEFKSPPEGGAPGEDYNCRCYAEPIMEGIA